MRRRESGRVLSDSVGVTSSLLTAPTRREFTSLIGGAFALSPEAHAQERTPKVRRIGYLAGGSPTSNPHFFETFRQGLRELGWVEGQNILIEYRSADGQYDRLPALAEQLVRLNVEVIVGSPTAAAVAARNATSTIPIVMRSGGDPVGLGLIASLARPGGNVTGLSYTVGTETIGKGLELLKEAVPDVHLVAVLSNPANPVHGLSVDTVKGVARSLGLELLLQEARGPDEFDGAFAAMARDRVGALLVVADAMFNVHEVRLVEFILRGQLPSMHGFREEVEAGGFMSYGPNFAAQFRQAATYVDKILRGAKPADLPVEQPTKFELVINLRTAKALGITLPPTLLAQADEVIE
jgi:putative ABC transport system substrate-binding protein